MGVFQGLAYYNDKMLTLAEHWDEFIMARTQKNPNIWHDRVPRGAYKLFNGLTQKSNIFRGGLPVQAGLSTWTVLGNSNKDTPFDNCAMPTPQRYSYAWETIQTKGYTDSWQSDPVCLNDMKFVDYAKEQLALIVRTGVDFGISMLENWNREMYVYQAHLSNRCMVMADGALEFEDNADYRFTYDPFLTTTDVDGDTVPYMTFSADIQMSTLNWGFLDYIRTHLADSAGEAAIGTDAGGLPVFGLYMDLIDFEKYIKSDSELREDWRNAQPQKLIDGYAMGTKVYRGMALMHDSRQMRFRIKSTTGAGGTVTATRVKPLRLGRAVTIGQVPEPNPDYYRAEIGIGVIFMNDVFMNLFVPSIDNLGSGMTFGPAPGMTGEWKWINIKDNVSNQLGESGYFFGRFQIFPKPLLFSFEATVFAYRRCPQVSRTVCEVQSASDVATGAVAPVANAAAGDFDLANRQVTLLLASKIDAGVGDTVTIKKADTNTFVATVLSDALAPKYVFGWQSGASNAPTAYTDFTAAGTTVTV